MTAIHQTPPCCNTLQQCVEEPTKGRLFHLLEKVSAIALGIFSAYANMALFLPFFFLGTAIGFYQHLNSDPLDGAPHRTVSCSQGLMEQLTGTKLPPLVSLISNLAITWCHIEHHTGVFVPVIGVSLGSWAGQSTGHLSMGAVQKENRSVPVKTVM